MEKFGYVCEICDTSTGVVPGHNEMGYVHLNFWFLNCFGKIFFSRDFFNFYL